MLLQAKDAKKFNLKIGGHINYKDAFYLMNYSEATKQKYFLHVDKSRTFYKDGIHKALEVNAGL
jgi:hypothetical protein